MLIREGTCWPPTFGMGAPSPFSPAVGNAPRRATQGDEAAEGVDPPRELLLICALQRLAGEAGSPIFLAPFPGAFPLTPAPGLAQIQVHPPPPLLALRQEAARAPPCPAPLRGGFGGKNKSAQGVGRGYPGPCSFAGPGAAESPREFVCKRKRPGERRGAGHCARCRPARGGCSPLPRFWQRFWGGGFRSARPRASPGPAAGAHPKERRLLRFSLPGQGRGSAGTVRSSAAPGPGSRAGCGHLGQIYFWCSKVGFFPPRGAGCEGRKERAIAVKRPPEMGLAGEFLPSSAVLPGPPTPPPQQSREPAGAQLGAVVFQVEQRRAMPGGCVDRGHLWVHFTGGFAREGWDRDLGPRRGFPLVRAPRRVPPGSLRLSAFAAPKLGGA